MANFFSPGPYQNLTINVIAEAKTFGDCFKSCCGDHECNAILVVSNSSDVSCYRVNILIVKSLTRNLILEIGIFRMHF